MRDAEPMTWLVLCTHAWATCGMAGLIWFVQIVHYPLMAKVGVEGYAAYQRSHEARTTWVVAPLMLIEAATSVALLWLMRAQPWGVAIAWTGAGLLAVIWASTFLLQVPAHQQLGGGFDAQAHRRLVSSNWIRTFAWTARGVLAIVLLYPAAWFDRTG